MDLLKQRAKSNFALKVVRMQKGTAEPALKVVRMRKETAEAVIVEKETLVSNVKTKMFVLEMRKEMREKGMSEEEFDYACPLPTRN